MFPHFAEQILQFQLRHKWQNVLLIPFCVNNVLQIAEVESPYWNNLTTIIYAKSVLPFSKTASFYVTSQYLLVFYTLISKIKVFIFLPCSSSWREFLACIPVSSTQNLTPRFNRTFQNKRGYSRVADNILLLQFKYLLTIPKIQNVLQKALREPYLRMGMAISICNFWRGKFDPSNCLATYKIFYCSVN